MIRSLLLAALATTSLTAAPSSPAPLRVSPGGQYFQQADGAPFFWLGDTAWLMTQKLTRDEVKAYFENRRAKGFNVVQFCVVQFLNDKSITGSPALVGGDITKLNVTPGADPADPAQYDYWDHVDYVVDTAAANGIHPWVCIFLAALFSDVWFLRYQGTNGYLQICASDDADRFDERGLMRYTHWMNLARVAAAFASVPWWHWLEIL
jgi:hypothetical protein